MCFYPFDFDVGFISGKFVGRIVVTGTYKGTDDDRGCFSIISDHGM